MLYCLMLNLLISILTRICFMFLLLMSFLLLSAELSSTFTFFSVELFVNGESD